MSKLSKSDSKSILHAFEIGAALAALIVGCSSLSGQELPDHPKPVMDKTEWALLAADASSRALDVYSTHKALSESSRNHEDLLPGFISNHSAPMAVYSAGTVALDWYVARKLELHHHSKLAHIVTMIDIGQDAPFAIHNLFLPGAKGGNLRKFR